VNQVGSAVAGCTLNEATAGVEGEPGRQPDRRRAEAARRRLEFDIETDGGDGLGKRPGPFIRTAQTNGCGVCPDWVGANETVVACRSDANNVVLIGIRSKSGRSTRTSAARLICIPSWGFGLDWN